MNDKLKSRKLLITLGANVALWVLHNNGWITGEQLGQGMVLLNGLYAVGQGIADHGKGNKAG